MDTDLKETYDRIAKDWERDHKSDNWWVDGTDHFCSLLPKRAHILDVGCGAGGKARYLTNKGFKVTGIDFSLSMLRIAHQNVPEAEFIELDMQEASMLVREFDAVFAQASLLHISHAKIEHVLLELDSVLKPGGLFYIAVKGVRPDGVTEHMLTESDCGYEYQRFFSYYTAEELKVHLMRFGIETIYESLNRVGKTDWIQLIGRKN